MDDETWKRIPDHPDYEVSDRGRVRSWRRRTSPLVLRQGLNPKGYPMVALQGEEGQRTRQVHRLVADAFLGPRPPGLVTRHVNGDQTDNRATNLAYGTRSENEHDKVRHGTHPQANRTECTNGHPYDEANTRRYRGRRYCITCQDSWNAARPTTRAGRAGVGAAA